MLKFLLYFCTCSLRVSATALQLGQTLPTRSMCLKVNLLPICIHETQCFQLHTLLWRFAKYVQRHSLPQKAWLSKFSVSIAQHDVDAMLSHVWAVFQFCPTLSCIPYCIRGSKASYRRAAIGPAQHYSWDAQPAAAEAWDAAGTWLSARQVQLHHSSGRRLSGCRCQAVRHQARAYQLIALCW